MWGYKNVIVSELILTPPPLEAGAALNSTSLYLFDIIGASIAPVPLPPERETEITLSISTSFGSTITFFNDPKTTRLTKAVVPSPTGLETTTGGG